MKIIERKKTKNYPTLSRKSQYQDKKEHSLGFFLFLMKNERKKFDVTSVT